MFAARNLRSWVMITLLLFAGSCLAPQFIRGDDEDPLLKAREMIRTGSFDEAERILEAYIERIRGIAKQKRQVAEAHYLLARMYHEVGDDPKCEENLRAALQFDPQVGAAETNADLRGRRDRIWAEVAPRVSEKEKEVTAARPRAKKKFPWLLVAGITAAAVIVILLLMKKKKDFTLSVVVSDGVTGSHRTGGYFYRKGTSLAYHFEAAADYKDLVVRIDGAVSPASGNLVMDRDIRLEASATAMDVKATLWVSGLDNCQEMVSSPAVFTSLPSGSFILRQVAGNAYLAGGKPFDSLLVCYRVNRDHLAVLPIPQFTSLIVGEMSGGSPLFTFFVESGPVADNYGEITLDFSSIQVNVHGKNNCFQLSDLPTARIGLPAGTYSLRISGSAYFYSETMDEVLVTYPDGSGNRIFKALPVGDISTISTAGGEFHAFFARYFSRPDYNSGQVKMEFLN